MMYRWLTFCCVAIALVGATWSLHEVTPLPGQEVGAAAAAELMGGTCGNPGQAYCGNNNISCSGLVSGCLSTGGASCDLYCSKCNSNCTIWGCANSGCSS